MATKKCEGHRELITVPDWFYEIEAIENKAAAAALPESLRENIGMCR
jgi:hypothetical protein